MDSTLVTEMHSTKKQTEAPVVTSEGPVGVVSYDNKTGEIYSRGAFRDVAELERFIAQSAESDGGFADGHSIRFGDRTVSYYAISTGHLFQTLPSGEIAAAPRTDPVVVFERNVSTGTPEAIGAYRSREEFFATLEFASATFGSKDPTARVERSEPERFIIPMR